MRSLEYPQKIFKISSAIPRQWENCWTNCGNLNAKYYHVFWDCFAIEDLWIGYCPKYFHIIVPLESRTIFFGLIPEEWLNRDWINILLVAGKKALTRTWISQAGFIFANVWLSLPNCTSFFCPVFVANLKIGRFRQTYAYNIWNSFYGNVFHPECQ